MHVLAFTSTVAFRPTRACLTSSCMQCVPVRLGQIPHGKRRSQLQRLPVWYATHANITSEARREPGQGTPAQSLSATAKTATLAFAACCALLTVSLSPLYASPAPTHAYGLEKGRLQKCRGEAPCISTTSVGNPSKFGAPWSYRPQTDDADEAWKALKEAVVSNKDGGSIVEASDGPETYYVRAEFPSTWRGIDDVEFRLVKQDALVSYRSASREAIFIYPLQTPINTNKNRNRLEDIRVALGWEEFDGLELFEGGSSGEARN